MKRIFLGLILLHHSGALCAESAQKDKELLKQKWMNWANERVSKAKEDFLKKYSIDPSALNDTQLHHDLKSSKKKMIEEMVGDYNDLHGMEASHHSEIVLEIAKVVFPADLHIKILSDNTFSFQQVGVFSNYSTNECFIVLNSQEHSGNIPRLKEILQHEAAHVFYEDNFNTDLIRCLAWVNSSDDRSQVVEASYPYCHAFETRADIYAALHSLGHGKHLIDLLKNEEEVDCATHPKPAERITLLERLRNDLKLLDQQ